MTISKANNDTFSNRYTYLFLNICSEIDSIAEEYCKVVKAPSKVKNILQKMTVIENNDPKIKNQKVSTKYPYEIINFVPFAGFDSESAAGKIITLSNISVPMFRKRESRTISLRT